MEIDPVGASVSLKYMSGLHYFPYFREYSRIHSLQFCYIFEETGIMRVRYFVPLVICLLLLTIYVPLHAQTVVTTAADSTCVRFIQTAFQQVGTNCANLEAGSLCYGHPNVSANIDETAVKNFSKIADRLSLENFTSIHTEDYDPAENNFGIAVMNIQASLPRAFPGKGAVMMAFGETTITNAVTPEDALILPEKAIDIIVGANGADLYNVPTGFNVPSQPFGSVPKGTTLQADGISVDAQWLRIYAPHKETFDENVVAWIKTASLVQGLDLSNLPTITAESYTPMQSFFLTTKFEEPRCKNAVPSLLYIQGPKDTLVDVTVDGAHIRFGSTILLRLLPPGNILQVVVLSGLGVIFPDTPDEIILPPGFETLLCLAPIPEGGNKNTPLVTKNCGSAKPRLLSFDEMQTLSTDFSNLIPENLQYYNTVVPRLVCPSGVGAVICTLELSDPLFAAELSNLCQDGTLPPETCAQLSLPSIFNN
ncbi:MAG: hypothetical protein R3E39_26760 [Anaerolineae bacterium]